MSPQSIIEHTLKHEGGYVNDPQDAGGETNFGISKRVFPDVDIKNLDRGGAIRLYLTHYYLPLKLDIIKSDAIKWKLFDIAVNLGSDDTIRIVPIVLKELGYITGDGFEYQRLNDAEVFWGTDKVVLHEIAEWQMRKYVDIVVKKPSQLKFLQNWTKRAFDIGEGLI